MSEPETITLDQLAEGLKTIGDIAWEQSPNGLLCGISNPRGVAEAIFRRFRVDRVIRADEGYVLGYVVSVESPITPGHRYQYLYPTSDFYRLWPELTSDGRPSDAA